MPQLCPSLLLVSARLLTSAALLQVIELANGYARQHLPPAYFDSPIMWVETWSDAPAMMMDLVKDTQALVQRQKKLQEWYNAFMRKTVLQLEQLLEQRRAMSLSA